MRQKISIILLITLLLYSHSLIAQKWGKVSKESLKMTSLAEAPEADAVILFDKCEMRITYDFDLTIKRHRRIKILTEKGKKYADVSISYWHKDKIYDLKAQTILPNGKKMKLKKRDVFENQDENWKEKVFAFPGVEVGAVIEYHYEKYCEYVTFLEPWYFQGREFTKLSELSVIILPGFNYNSFFQHVPYEKTKPIEEQVHMLNPRFPPSKFTWRLENIPAIKTEPYMSNYRDYLAAIYFQLVSYKAYKFIKTWDDLAKNAREFYNDYLNMNKGLKNLVSEILLTAEDGIKKEEALYDYVNNMIETTDYNGFMSERLKKPHEIFKQKKGSAVEKNLLLINLLRHAGLEAYPLLISTRDHGRVYENWVQLAQFNHVIAYVQSENGVYFLDTKNKYIPFGLLPCEDLNHKGFLVENDGGRIIRLQHPRNINMRYADTKATLTATGDLICETVLRFEGYRGIVERTNLSEQNEEDYINEILEDRFAEVTIDSFEILNTDVIEIPLFIKIYYQVHNYCQASGKMVYLMPTLIHRLQSNPFKLEKRTFPVEYNYRRASMENIELTIPSSYQIIERPKSVRMKDKNLQFMAACKAEENHIQFQRQFMLFNDVISPREYADLRDQYERIVSCDQCQLVLAKSE